MAISRRGFLKTTAGAAGAAALAWPVRNVLGANDTVRVGFIGLGGRGRHSVKWFSGLPDVEVVGLADPDKSALASAQKSAPKAKTYSDLRKLLEDKSVDAVVVSTCNHWHALATVWACQAGKDVYCEKPLSHSIWEGRKVVEAMTKYKRIVQTGTQNRSDVGLRPAFEFIQSGQLGKIKMVRGFCYRDRGSIGKVDGPQPIPSNVDYDLWSGPRETVPLMRKKLQYDWHWVWATGNGDIGNQGPHETDLCRWVLGKKNLPPRVISIGGRFCWNDDGETANTQLVVLDYGDVPILFEVRNLGRKKGEKTQDAYKGVRVGVVVECEGGYFAGGRGGGWTYDNKGERIKQYKGDAGGNHHRNFIDAVRSRKLETLHSDANEGHLSASLAHMGNISHRVGKGAGNDACMEAVKANKEACECLGRITEHLKKNEVDFTKTPLTLGPWLTMDAAQEKFTGEFADQANKLVRETYRSPYVIPDQV